MLKQFGVRWLANGVGLWAASELIPGIESDNLAVIIIAALVFSIVNAFIRPIAVLLSLPAIILSLGLFMLIINALMLYLVTAIYPRFIIESFGSAVMAVIVVWVMNYAISALFQRPGVTNA